MSSREPPVVETTDLDRLTRAIAARLGRQLAGTAPEEEAWIAPEGAEPSPPPEALLDTGRQAAGAAGGPPDARGESTSGEGSGGPWEGDAAVPEAVGAGKLGGEGGAVLVAPEAAAGTGVAEPVDETAVVAPPEEGAGEKAAQPSGENGAALAPVSASECGREAAECAQKERTCPEQTAAPDREPVPPHELPEVVSPDEPATEAASEGAAPAPAGDASEAPEKPPGSEAAADGAPTVPEGPGVVSQETGPPGAVDHEAAPASAAVSEAAALELVGAARALPIPRGSHIWRLASPPLPAYGCAVCGATWLRPGDCCGQPARETATPYYTAAGSPEPAAAPEFSVIMLTRDNLALTRTAVESLRRARGGHAVEFIFVDGCSTDGSLNYFRELAESEAVRLIVTHRDEPFLYSRNCNRGAEAARGRFLLFANNDIEVRDADLFAKLARGLSDPRVGVIGTRTDYDCGNELQERESLPGERVWSARPVMGFLWGTRAEVFGELGGLDEQFVDYGCDEVDLEYRAIRRNYRIAVVDSLVHHEVHATFGAHIIPSLTRNVERFNAKHGCRLIQGGEWYVPFLAHSYPRVSVAVACRNHGRYLARALDSALGSYLPRGAGLQVVVVNDASVDETASVLEPYRQRYPEQVNVLHRHVSHGPAAAKNQAMARCIGDYVALLDADDEFLECKLWRCLETLEETGGGFVYHDFAFVFPDGRHERRSLAQWSLDRWLAGGCSSIPPSTWMFRSGCVQFCERLVTGEDPEFLRRRWSTLDAVHLPELLTRYYVHGDSLSQRAMCRVVTGQLRGLPYADVGGCSDVPAAPWG